MKKLVSSITPLKPIREYHHLISEESEMYLQVLVSGEPDLILEDIIDNYAEIYGVRVSIGTMFNTLKKLNITYKKKSTI